MTVYVPRPNRAYMKGGEVLQRTYADMPGLIKQTTRGRKPLSEYDAVKELKRLQKKAVEIYVKVLKGEEVPPRQVMVARDILTRTGVRVMPEVPDNGVGKSFEERLAEMGGISEGIEVIRGEELLEDGDG